MTTFVTREAIFFGGEIKCVLGSGGGGGGGWGWTLFQYGGVRNLVLDHVLPESLVLICRTAPVIGNMRSPTFCALLFPLVFVWAVFL